MKAWIGLGSNMGKRERYLVEALAEMEKCGLKVLARSSVLETKAYGKTDQEDFLNQVCLVDTAYSPRALLNTLLDIERRMGRVRKEHWGPRIIDLDLLFYEEEIVTEKDLIVPHADIENRRFVLAPLAELSPDFVHPVLHRSVKELLQDLDARE